MCPEASILKVIQEGATQAMSPVYHHSYGILKVSDTAHTIVSLTTFMVCGVRLSFVCVQRMYLHSSRQRLGQV